MPSRSKLPRFLAGLLLAASTTFGHAEPVSRSVTIAVIHPMAVQRTHCPTCSGITRVYLNPEAWGSTDCRPDAADLFLEDMHILATLLFAKKNNLPVKLEVNSTVKPIDEVCKVTAAYIG